MYTTPFSIDIENHKTYRLQRFGFCWFKPKLIWTSLKTAHAAITDRGIAEHHFAFPHPTDRWAKRLHAKSSAWILAAQMTCRLAKEKSSYMIINRETKAAEGYILLRPDYILQQASFTVPCLGFALFTQDSLPSPSTDQKALIVDSVRSLLRHALKNPEVAQIKSFVHNSDAPSASILTSLGFERTGMPLSSRHMQGRAPCHFSKRVLYGRKAQKMGLRATP